MNSSRPTPQLDADWLLLLFWAIPAVVLTCVYLVLALTVSPLLMPYLAIRRFRGRDAANRFADVLITLFVVLICGYQAAIWLADPASFYWPPR
jgi:hypothetical protein